MSFQSFVLLFSLWFRFSNAKSQDKLSQSLASIKEKVQDVQIDKTTFKQSIDILDESKGKLSFVSVLVDEKGKTSKERFEFYVSDIDKNTIIRKTSGKKLFISLSINNNQKFIKHFKEDKLEAIPILWKFYYPVLMQPRSWQIFLRPPSLWSTPARKDGIQIQMH